MTYWNNLIENGEQEHKAIEIAIQALTEKLQREENKELVSDYSDMHCGECPMIDCCNEYEDTPPCCQPRFEKVSLKDFLSVVDYIQNKNNWQEEPDEENKALTNFDRITASPQALTDYIAERTRKESGPREQCFLLKKPFINWLNEPVESEDK